MEPYHEKIFHVRQQEERSSEKTPSLKPNKHNDVSVRSMKNCTKEKFLELLRKTDFSNYTTFSCLNEAYQDFIFKLIEVIDLLCPSKN